MAPTNLEFGPWVLPSPVPGSQDLRATDMGCLPACLISPSSNRITASSGCSTALASPQGRDTWGCGARPLTPLVGSEETQQPEHRGVKQPPHTAYTSQSS